MLGKLARTVFGSANDRFVKRQFKIVQQINALEPEIEKLNNDELKGKTDEFRRRPGPVPGSHGTGFFCGGAGGYH